MEITWNRETGVLRLNGALVGVYTAETDAENIINAILGLPR